MPIQYEELQQYVSQRYFFPEYMKKTTYDYAQYTYVECPDSDSGNLLVKFVGLNIDSLNDDSFAVYVITEKDGQLYLTDGYECQSRNYTEKYRNGLCRTFGSQMAGGNYLGTSAILSNGMKTYIYEVEISDGWQPCYVDGTVYNEVFGENMDVPLNVLIYTVGGESYYMYDLSDCTGELKRQCEAYIDRCRDNAEYNWITDEQLQEIIQKRCSAIGVDYDMLGQWETAEWAKA